MPGIEMANTDLSMGRNEQSEVQSGGGSSGIEMANTDLSMSSSPIGSAQVGKGMGNIDMIGEQGMLSTTPSRLYGETYPMDKGK